MKQLLLVLIGLFILIVSITITIELRNEIEAVEGLRENLYDN